MADNDENDTSGVPLTPEERITKLEKSKTLSLIVIIVLSVLCLIQLGGLGYLLLQPADNRAADNSVAVAALDAQVVELQKKQNQTERLILQNQLLETKLNQVLEKANISNYEAIRQLLIQQEQNHVQFITALQRGMYELSRMVRGSRTWFEVYKEELDSVLDQSRRRIEELERPTPISDPDPEGGSGGN